MEVNCKCYAKTKRKERKEREEEEEELQKRVEAKNNKK